VQHAEKIFKLNIYSSQDYRLDSKKMLIYSLYSLFQNMKVVIIYLTLHLKILLENTIAVKCIQLQFW